MRVKDSYSLCIDELLGEMTMTDNLPAQYDAGITSNVVYGKCAESLNLIEALGNYIVERNRTKNLEKQFDAMKNALDSRNLEARHQSQIIINECAERLNNFLASERERLKIETQRIELESTAKVQQLQNDRERKSAEIQSIRKSLEYFGSILNEEQNLLDELKHSPQTFVTRNKFYYQVKEDHRIHLKWVQQLLKQID